MPIANKPVYPSHRATGHHTATVANGGTKSSIVDITLFGQGAIYLPAEFNSDAISFEGSNKVDGTFAAICGSDGNAVTFNAAAGARWYALAASVMAFNFIKIVTNTATAAAAEIELSLKS